MEFQSTHYVELFMAPEKSVVSGVGRCKRKNPQSWKNPKLNLPLQFDLCDLN